MRCQFLPGRRDRERDHPGQQGVERAPQAVDVGPPIDTLTFGRLFWRDVVGGSQAVMPEQHGQREFRFEASVSDERQSKVDDPRRPGGIDHQVCRLNVTMNHSGVVGRLQPEGRLPHTSTGLPPRESRLQQQQLVESDSAKKLQDQVRDGAKHILPGSGCERPDHMRVPDPPAGLEFRIQPGEDPPIVAKLLRDNFQGPQSSRRALPDEVQQRHPPGSQQFEHREFINKEAP